jgi:hypothetical protein
MTAAGGRVGGRRPTAARPRADEAGDAATGSRLPVSAVALSAAAGLVVVAAADAAGRLGHASAPWADGMYWFGQALILAPVWARMVSRRLLSAAGTATLVVVLTVAEYLVKVCYSPAAFLYPDELTHWRGTVEILRAGKLSTVNYLLPISSRYPGLEEVAAALASVTGLSVFVTGLIVAGVAHLLFVCVLYILFGNVSGSHRVAGTAVLLYASNPLFQSFDSMFIYQTVALPFLGLAVLAAWRLATPDRTGNRVGWLTVAVLSVTATVVTHHVTSYMLVATLVVIALAGLLTGDRRTRNWAAMLALLSAMAVAGWLVFEAPQTRGYLEPAVAGTLRGLTAVLGGGHGSAPPAPAAPLGNLVLGAAGVLTLSALLPFGWWQALRRYRRQPWVVAMALGSVSWYLIVAVRFAVADGSELAGRAATFVYVPTGFTAALALAHFMGAAFRRRATGPAGRWRATLAAGAARRWRAAFTVAAVLAGGLLLSFDGLANGWPPFWERLPGPHQVAGAERSVGPEEIAAAKWALAALGPGNRFAADSGSYPVLGSYGDQNPVRDVGYLYTSPAFTPSDAERAHAQALRYLLVDRRLAAALPVSGQYFPVDPEAGKYSRPLRAADLAKFDYVPSVARIYDSGDIVIYDLERAGYGG